MSIIMLKSLTLRLFLLVVVTPQTASASSRTTPWLYEARTMTEGEVEYEQWDAWISPKLDLESTH